MSATLANLKLRKHVIHGDVIHYIFGMDWKSEEKTLIIVTFKMHGGIFFYTNFIDLLTAG